MTYGIHPILDICKKCQFLYLRESKRLPGTSFMYCRVGEQATKVPMNCKQHIASIRPEGTRTSAIPNECVFYLEQLLSQKNMNKHIPPSSPENIKNE